MVLVNAQFDHGDGKAAHKAETVRLSRLNLNDGEWASLFAGSVLFLLCNSDAINQDCIRLIGPHERLGQQPLFDMVVGMIIIVRQKDQALFVVLIG